MTLENKIDKIGQKMANCKENCDGVANDPNNNIFPRCLVHQSINKTHKTGFIVVGQNPGHAREQEIKRYDESNYVAKNKHDRFVFQKEDFLKIIETEQYYKEITKFIEKLNALGIESDAIIWTEALHCESAHRVDKIKIDLESWKFKITKGLKIIDFRSSNLKKIGDNLYHWIDEEKIEKMFDFSNQSWKRHFNSSKDFDKKNLLKTFKKQIEISIKEISDLIKQIDGGKSIAINSIKYITKLSLKKKDYEEVKIPISTYSNCVNRHLNNIFKIDECKSWPVFVFDKIVFNYLCLAYPDRKIVRLNHPSKKFNSSTGLGLINADESRLTAISSFLKNPAPPNQFIG